MLSSKQRAVLQRLNRDDRWLSTRDLSRFGGIGMLNRLYQQGLLQVNVVPGGKGWRISPLGKEVIERAE